MTTTLSLVLPRATDPCASAVDGRFRAALVVRPWSKGTANLVGVELGLGARSADLLPSSGRVETAAVDSRPELGSDGELQEWTTAAATAAADSPSECRGAFVANAVGLTQLERAVRSCNIRGLGASISLTLTVCKGMPPSCEASWPRCSQGQLLSRGEAVRGDTVRGEGARGELRWEEGREAGRGDAQRAGDKQSAGEAGSGAA